MVEEPESTRGLRLAGAVGLGVALGMGVVLLVQQRTKVDPTPAPAAIPQKVETGAPVVPPPPAPTPSATRGLVPTPTAPPLSFEASGLAGRVSLDLRHPFASGTLRIKVDERVVFANNISGMPIRVLGVTSGYDGRFGTDLVIPPGDHVIKIEVRSGSTEFVESRRVQIRAGESRRLVALVGKTLILSFE